MSEDLWCVVADGTQSCKRFVNDTFALVFLCCAIFLLCGVISLELFFQVIVGYWLLLIAVSYGYPLVLCMLFHTVLVMVKVIRKLFGIENIR